MALSFLIGPRINPLRVSLRPRRFIRETVVGPRQKREISKMEESNAEERAAEDYADLTGRTASAVRERLLTFYRDTRCLLFPSLPSTDRIKRRHVGIIRDAR